MAHQCPSIVEMEKHILRPPFDALDGAPLQARGKTLRQRKAQILASLNNTDQFLAFELGAKAPADGFDFR